MWSVCWAWGLINLTEDIGRQMTCPGLKREGWEQWLELGPLDCIGSHDLPDLVGS